MGKSTTARLSLPRSQDSESSAVHAVTHSTGTLFSFEGADKGNGTTAVFQRPGGFFFKDLSCRSDSHISRKTDQRDACPEFSPFRGSAGTAMTVRRNISHQHP